MHTVRERLASLNERHTFADRRVTCNSRGVGEAYCPALWTHPDSSETVTKGGNNGIKMRDHERSSSQEQRGSGTPRLYCHYPFTRSEGLPDGKVCL